MYAIYIYGNIYHQYTSVMLAYIPAPWIRHGYRMESMYQGGEVSPWPNKKTSPDSSPGIIGHQGAQKGNLPDSSVTLAGYRAANPKKCEILFAFDFKLRYFKWKNEQGCFQHPRLPQNVVLFFSTQKWDGATLMKKVQYIKIIKETWHFAQSRQQKD